jgi:hypothetical protein
MPDLQTAVPPTVHELATPDLLGEDILVSEAP